MRILLCEDDEDVRSSYKAFLENAGIEVSAFKCGYDALRALSTQKFDAVFTDYVMNEGDGGMLSNFCGDRGMPCAVFTGMEPNFVRPYVPTGIPIFGKSDFFDIAAKGLLGQIASPARTVYGPAN